MEKVLKDDKIRSLPLAILFLVLTRTTTAADPSPRTLLLRYTGIYSLAHCPNVYIGRVAGTPILIPF